MDCTRNGRCSWPTSFTSSPSVSSVYLFSPLSFTGEYVFLFSVCVMFTGEHDPIEVELNCNLISFEKEKESEAGWRDSKGGVTKRQVTTGHFCKDSKTCPVFFFVFFFIAGTAR